MAFQMGIVWTVQPFWSHHPRYPLPAVRVAAPCVDGDFRVDVSPRVCSDRRKFCGPSAPIAYATSGSSSAKPNYLISRLNGWSSLSFGIRFACWLPSCPNGSCMQLSIGNQWRISCMRPSVCSPPYLYLYSCFCWN